jgi:hypothetical protein
MFSLSFTNDTMFCFFNEDGNRLFGLRVFPVTVRGEVGPVLDIISAYRT